MPALNIRTKQPSDDTAWDQYVRFHPEACVYHLSGWQAVIERTYGHRTYYLLAEENDHGTIAGVLPLVHLRSLLFGNHLVSIPFFDSAGMLCHKREAAEALIAKALRLAGRLGARSIELRQSKALGELLDIIDKHGRKLQTKAEKERLVLELPATASDLMSGFKAKLRSQIKNPIKKGLQVRTGGRELLDDFYSVFAVNMRDLGSPVHSVKLMASVLEAFPDHSKIFIVHQNGCPLACSLAIAFGTLLANPWASSLRQYSFLNANMLLYWSMLEYACERGLRFFDFGRSSPDEGTYKFKQQWGAKPMPTFWYNISVEEQPVSSASPDKRRFDRMIAVWQKLPVSLTRLIGPPIRKRISL
jgi:FemAB-related protein (PEP-CTERM system-associated)